MTFRHLDYAAGTPVTRLGAAALDDLLDRGDLQAWAPLAAAIRRDPRGELAATALRLCEAHPMYGTSALWIAWIRRLCREADGTSLAGLRTAAGMSQADVAARLGISQSDVSKLERRSDVRLSTLRAYVESVGAELELRVTPVRGGPPKTLELRRRPAEPRAARSRHPSQAGSLPSSDGSELRRDRELPSRGRGRRGQRTRNRPGPAAPSSRL